MRNKSGQAQPLPTMVCDSAGVVLHWQPLALQPAPVAVALVDALRAAGFDLAH